MPCSGHVSRLQALAMLNFLNLNVSGLELGHTALDSRLLSVSHVFFARVPLSRLADR